MSRLKKTINLLPKDELEKTPIGKFLKWTLTFGRYIVIFTELIVILAFLARFKFDRDLANLHEEIERKQAIIISFENLENNVRFLQKQLEIIKKIETESLDPSLVLEELSKITPIDMAFNELTIQDESISIEGNSLSNVGLNTFLNGLKSNKLFSQINLESISSRGKKDPTIKFRLSVKLNKDKNGY